ncbi:MAG: Mor transcription activator family protein [Sodalis sp. (in: enterobacteria)]|uniref:Mor transcription activator family protein n=1 Tax=Sodalis sp. (in: enterobacteria) TaxID=1898979 RepID=UPI003F3FB2B1
MLENTLCSKGLELLVELAEHTAQTVRQIIDVDPAVASQMMTVWGGQNVYFLMGLIWKVSQRDREIFADFNNYNHHALARKYKVSLQWIYSVVKRVKKEELARIQGSLFEDEDKPSG